MRRDHGEGRERERLSLSKISPGKVVVLYFARPQQGLIHARPQCHSIYYKARLAASDAASKGRRGGSGVGDRRVAAAAARTSFVRGHSLWGESGRGRAGERHCMGTSLETSARKKAGGGSRGEARRRAGIAKSWGNGNLLFNC